MSVTRKHSKYPIDLHTFQTGEILKSPEIILAGGCFRASEEAEGGECYGLCNAERVEEGT